METEEEVQVLLEGLDETNISSLLQKYNEVHNVKTQTEKLEAMLKDKIKVYLKEREWDQYSDQRTKISVSITTGKKQTVDKTQLKIMLTDAQMAQVIRTTTFEKMMIMTPEARARLKQYAGKPKK
jgi:hypothetical protein